jgi:competence protein ComEA
MNRPGVRLVPAVLAAVLALSACGLLRGDGTAAAPKPLDLNAAPLRKIEALPGITPSMARRIVDGRPYAEPRDLVERGILTERELKRIADRVRVGPDER